MSRRNRKPQNKEPEPPLTIEVEGAGIESVIAEHEEYVPLSEYQRVKRAADEQAAELELLRAGQRNGKHEEPGVKKHLRCPSCWKGLGGKAARRKWQRQVNGPKVNRCYVCDKCGCEWVVEVNVEEYDDGITYRETKVVEVRSGDRPEG